MYKALALLAAVAVMGVTLLVHASLVRYERTGTSLTDMPTFAPEAVPEPLTIQFVGDLMLGRDVENKMNIYGAAYPYGNIVGHLTAPYVVGNFEASMPVVHVPTPSMTMRFSVDPRFVPALGEAGFTHLSLANNHGYDYGAEGYQNARAHLAAAGAVPFGHPYELATSSVAYIEHGEVTVALVGIYAVVSVPDHAALSRLARETTLRSDLQVAYLHWGNEYETVHSSAQEELAHALVDQGFDLIIGHHPHVVQDIGMYEGVPILYSLGNFVFDQYFSVDVQQGLMVTFVFDADGRCTLTLVPVSSEETRNAPSVMGETARGSFLRMLADRSDATLRTDIEAGVLPFSCEASRLHTHDNSI